MAVGFPRPNPHIMSFSTQPRLVQSLPGGLVNGVINGAISWFAFKGSTEVPLSVDSIASPGITALGNAATTAFALTLILTSITFFTFRAAARKAGGAPAALTYLAFWPTGLRLALRNTLLAFGGFIAVAVLWQRYAGTVLVGPLAAALVVAGVAVVASMLAEWWTKTEMLDAARPALGR
jgi:hypothetical protein